MDNSQFMSTRLFDKNNNEIFVGSRLKVPNTHFHIEGVHEVFIYNNQFVTSNVLFPNKEIAKKYDLDFILSEGAILLTKKAK